MTEAVTDFIKERLYHLQIFIKYYKNNSIKGLMKDLVHLRDVSISDRLGFTLVPVVTLNSKNDLSKWKIHANASK